MAVCHSCKASMPMTTFAYRERRGGRAQKRNVLHQVAQESSMTLSGVRSACSKQPPVVALRRRCRASEGESNHPRFTPASLVSCSPTQRPPRTLRRARAWRRRGTSSCCATPTRSSGCCCGGTSPTPSSAQVPGSPCIVSPPTADCVITQPYAVRKQRIARPALLELWYFNLSLQAGGGPPIQRRLACA